MTRTLHDQFAKLCLAGFLEPFGTAEIGRELTSEVRQVDLWFDPDPARLDSQAALGLLGRMVGLPCLLEPFRNAIQAGHILDCQSKLNEVRLELLRKAKSQKVRQSQVTLPQLWMISPTVSPGVLQAFGAIEKADWLPGVYFLPEGQRAAIVAINQLPVTSETLWLRLLGRERIQAQAVSELMMLPKNHPFRTHALQQLMNLRTTLEARQNLNRDERGLIMSLSPIYEQWEEETLRRGRQEGRQEGREEVWSQAFPILLETGLTVEQIAERFQVDVNTVQRVLQLIAE